MVSTGSKALFPSVSLASLLLVSILAPSICQKICMCFVKTLIRAARK